VKHCRRRIISAVCVHNDNHWSVVENSLVCTILVCLLSVMIKCWVERAGSGPETGKGKVGFCVGRGVWGRGWVRGCMRMRGLFKFVLEVSKYGIEDFVHGKGVIIIKVVVYGRLSMYVEALCCVKVDAFFLEL